MASMNSLREWKQTFYNNTRARHKVSQCYWKIFTGLTILMGVRELFFDNIGLMQRVKNGQETEEDLGFDLEDTAGIYSGSEEISVENGRTDGKK